MVDLDCDLSGGSIFSEMNDTGFKEEWPQAEEKSYPCLSCRKARKLCSQPSGDKQTEDNAVSCEECGRKPKCKIRLVNSKPSVTSYACDTCGKKFNRKDNLVVHFRIHTGEKDYVCSICGKRFAHKNTLKGHQKVHTGEKNFSCEICEKKFTFKSSLKEHIITSEGKTFPCNKCIEVFPRKSCLIYHKLVYHKRDKDKGPGTVTRRLTKLFKTGDSFVCKICSKEFSIRYHLTRHARVHVEKSFMCEYCGKKFRIRNHLETHITIHTGERKFACGDCGKRFSQKSHLRVHARTHTGERNYVCGECGRRFNIKSHLNYHVRIHTRKKLICDTCGEEFHDKGALTLHLKKHMPANVKGKKTRGRRAKVFKSEMKECYICQEKFSDEALLHKHCEDHEQKNSLHSQSLIALNSDSPTQNFNSEVQEIENALCNILPLDNYEANSSCVVKTDISDAVLNISHKKWKEEMAEFSVE
ncbi:zinc finger protein 883-like [Palaemon carinicauda]|uniref:zinc finger protein 883-like n=1 Tax=Palaemon carinicauda TaxID=392227 RepID=UPI0035B58C4C